MNSYSPITIMRLSMIFFIRSPNLKIVYLHIIYLFILCNFVSCFLQFKPRAKEDKLDIGHFSYRRMMICPDFLEFQDNLKKMRFLDDKIVYTLNTSLPTDSFAKKIDTQSVCQDLHSQIQKVHTERENVIKNCILSTAAIVKKLKVDKDNKPDDYDILKNLKAEQKKLRLLQTELSVEEVIRDKTTNLFTDKCRGYFKPNIL